MAISNNTGAILVAWVTALLLLLMVLVVRRKWSAFTFTSTTTTSTRRATSSRSIALIAKSSLLLLVVRLGASACIIFLITTQAILHHSPKLVRHDLLVALGDRIRILAPSQHLRHQKPAFDGAALGEVQCTDAVLVLVEVELALSERGEVAVWRVREEEIEDVLPESSGAVNEGRSVGCS